MWPSENPWPITMVCLLAAVGLLIAWSNQRRGKLLVAALACLMIGGLAIVYDSMVMTPAEQVRTNIYEMTRAFQQRDLEKTYSFISDSAWDVRLLAAQGYNLVKVSDDMRVTDVQIRLVASNQRAISRFRVNATLSSGASGMSHRSPTMWEAKWQPEEDPQHPGKEVWRMIEISALDPITGEPQSYLEQLREKALRQYPRN